MKFKLCMVKTKVDFCLIIMALFAAEGRRALTFFAKCTVRQLKSEKSAIWDKHNTGFPRFSRPRLLQSSQYRDL